MAGGRAIFAPAAAGATSVAAAAKVGELGKEFRICRNVWLFRR